MPDWAWWLIGGLAYYGLAYFFLSLFKINKLDG